MRFLLGMAFIISKLCEVELRTVMGCAEFDFAHHTNRHKTGDT